MEVTYSFPDLGNVKRETIGESYCTFNKLIKGKSFGDFLNAEDFISKGNGLSKFEQNLRLIAIDSFQLTENVVKILLSQDNDQIKRILSCNWFFKSSMTPEQLCTEVFPHVSLSLRHKLISKLSKKITSAENAEKLMNFVQKNYSRAEAELFLPRCSPSVIKAYFLSNKPIQHSKTIQIWLYISRRHPTLVLEILSFFLNNGSNYNLKYQKKALLFLASNHPNTFIPFFEHYHSELCFLNFGAKLSKKLGPQFKDIIFKTSQIMDSRVFNKAALFKVLQFEEKVKFLTTMVIFKKKKLTFFNWLSATYEMILLLKLVPPNKRLQMIELVFKQVFNFNINNYIKMFSPQLMELIPLNQRLPYVRAYETALVASNSEDIQSCGFFDDTIDWEPSKDPENFLYLYPANEAFERYKQLLKKAPNLFKRQDIIQYMVKLCSINKDISSLKDLVDFVLMRFRNDSPQVFIQFLYEIFDSFPHQSLSVDIIEKMEEMLDLCFVRNEKRSYGHLIEKSLLFKLNKNLDIDDRVQQIVDWRISANAKELIYDFKHPQSRKLFFKYYSVILKSVSYSPNKEICNWILSVVTDFNRSHKKNLIVVSEVPEFMPYLSTIMEKNTNKIFSDFETLNKIKSQSVNLCLTESKYRLIKYIIKHYPNVIVDKLENLIDFFIVNYEERLINDIYPFCLSFFSFVNVTVKVKEILALKLNNEKNIAKKRNTLKLISRTFSIDEFEKLLEPYIPKEEKIDHKQNAGFLEIQLLVPRVVRHIKPSWKNYNFTLKYFKGDFFKEILWSFYNCCYNTRCDYIIPTLVTYLEKNASHSKIAIKKELIRVLLQVSNFHEAINVFEKCWDLIDHYSIRTLIFKRASNSFLQQPTEENFTLIKKFINESDELVIEARPDPKEVPKELFKDYVLTLWAFSEKQTLEIKNSIQDSIISSIKLQNVCLLPNDFYENFIEKNIGNNNSMVNKLASYYIISDLFSVPARVAFILQKFKTKAVDPKLFSNFLHVLRNTVHENSETSSAVLKNLLQQWPYNSKAVLFEALLIINYYEIYQRFFCKSNDWDAEKKSEEFGKELKKFFCNHDNHHHLTEIFLSSFNVFINELEAQKQSFNLLVTLKELVKEPFEVGLANLVVLLIPDDIVKLHNMDDRTFDCTETVQRGHLNQIIHHLNSYQSEIVQIYFRKKFGFKTSELQQYLI